MNETILALNQLAGFPVASVRPPSTAQIGAIDHIRCIHNSIKVPLDVPKPQEASRVLLGSAPSYGGEATTVRPYDRGLLSIPTTGSVSADLVDGLPVDAQHFLRDLSNMLVDEQELGKIAESQTHITNYMDHKLKHSTSTYHQFIRDMHSSGLIRWERRPLGRVTVFCVVKKKMENYV